MRRYRIAISGRGYHGLLVSDRTKIPGLVSIYDIPPDSGSARRGQATAPHLARRPGSREHAPGARREAHRRPRLARAGVVRRLRPGCALRAAHAASALALLGKGGDPRRPGRAGRRARAQCARSHEPPRGRARAARHRRLGLGRDRFRHPRPTRLRGRSAGHLPRLPPRARPLPGDELARRVRAPSGRGRAVFRDLEPGRDAPPRAGPPRRRPARDSGGAARRSARARRRRREPARGRRRRRPRLRSRLSCSCGCDCAESR